MAYNPNLPLSNSDIVKGSMLQIKIGDSIIGFATSHSLSITTNTTEVSTKEHGDYPAILAQTLTWEVQCENLYTDANEAYLVDIQLKKTPVTIVFSKVQYSNTDEKGIVDAANGSNTWSVSQQLLTGTAYLTSFSVNAPAGDNATISCTFTGSGALSVPSNP